MIILRKGGLNMFGRIKISNEECVLALFEINGVVPEDWFVAVNKGKDKRVHYAFIVNNTDDAIQLIPIKKESKKLVIDKENIIILSKSDDIKKCIVLIEDTHDHFYIHLNNGFKFRLVIRRRQFDKDRKKIYKSFRKQFTKQSLVPQTLDVIFNALIVLLSLTVMLWGILNIPNSTSLYKHYAAACDLKQTVDSGYFDKYMTVTLEQYSHSDLEFESDVYTVTHGKLRLNLPLDCKLNKEASLEDSTDNGFATYTTDLEEEKALSVMIDSQPIDFSNNNIEGYAELIDTLRDTAIKEFGVSLDNHYNLTKAMWQMNSLEDNINYFSRNEVALYRFMLVMKMTMSSGVNNYYEINTPSYCGFISVRNIGDSDSTIVNLDVFSYENLNESYQITVFVRNGNINDAFKIINSVEFVTE